MPLTQFTERVVDFPVARQRRALTVLTVQKTFEILQVPFLGLVLDSPLLCFTGRGPRPCDHPATSSSSDSGGASNSVYRQSGCFVVDRDRYQQTFLFVLFIDFGIQCGCAHAVFTWFVELIIETPAISLAEEIVEVPVILAMTKVWVTTLWSSEL